MADSLRVFSAEGDSVPEAVAAACRAGDLDPDQVMVEVLTPGGAAVPGERISGARAKVVVEAVPTEGLTGRRNLEVILRLMGIDAEVELRRAHRDAPAEAGPTPLILEVQGVDLGVLIGWRGESLRALQTVVNLMLGEVGLASGRPRLIVDVAGYRQRREHTVAQMALRVAAGVVRSGRAVTLEPMAPYERRAIHLALAGDPAVSTESTGVDGERRVMIRPAGEAAR